jgi:lysophospholipase L1-like esterase
MLKHRFVLILLALVGLILLFIAIEYLLVTHTGSPVPAPVIPRAPQTSGSGPPLTYVVMGDSTSIGQGTEYPHGYSYQSAQHLAQRYTLTYVNVGVSGAKAHDVLSDQLLNAIARRPDLVLIAVGANDVTHLTSESAVRASMQATIDGLRKANPGVRIVVTGSPAMGSVPRFPWPLRQFEGYRANRLNRMFAGLVSKNNLTFAPVAAKTGPAFARDPTLFAADKFHPNTRGYTLWTPVINEALDRSLNTTSGKP